MDSEEKNSAEHLQELQIHCISVLFSIDDRIKHLLIILTEHFEAFYAKYHYQHNIHLAHFGKLYLVLFSFSVLP